MATENITVNGIEYAPAKTQKKKLWVALVVDRSASMNIARDATIRAINDQIDSIKQGAETDKDTDTRVSLLTFNHLAEYVYKDKPAYALQHIVETDYAPTGNTALYDGVGETVTYLTNESELVENGNVDKKFLVIIVTDGHENASKIFTSEQVSSLIKENEASGNWTFSYTGANQDLKVVQEKLGVSRTRGYKMDEAGMQDYGTVTRMAINSFYSNRVSGVSNSSDTFGDALDQAEKEISEKDLTKTP
jgi:hypothetical protein